MKKNFSSIISKAKSLLLITLMVISSLYVYSLSSPYSDSQKSSEKSNIIEHYYRTLTSESGSIVLMGVDEGGAVAHANQPTLRNLIKNHFGLNDEEVASYESDLAIFIYTGSSPQGIQWPIKCRTVNCSIHGPGCTTCWWAGF